jgi:hypothetical protein
MVTKAAALSVVGISTEAEIAARFVLKFNKEFSPQVGIQYLREE